MQPDNNNQQTSTPAPTNVQNNSPEQAIKRYSNYPFFTRGTVLRAVALAVAAPALLTFIHMLTDIFSPREFLSILIVFTFLYFDYYLFFFLPSVLYLRKTGRYLYLETTGQSMKFFTHSFFFRPFGREPEDYGATKMRLPFLVGIASMALFLFVFAMPTIFIVTRIIGS